MPSVARGRVSVGVDVDGAKAISGLKQLGDKADTTFNKFKRPFGGGLKGIVAGVAGGIASVNLLGKAFDFVSSSIKDAADEQVNVAKLARTLSNAGVSKSTIDSTEQWITSLQNATGILDDELRPALSKLVSAGVPLNKSQAILKQALDISAARGIDLQRVVVGLGRAYGGNVAGLARFGVQTKKQITVTEVVGQKFDKLGRAIAGTGREVTKTKTVSKTFAEIMGELQHKVGGAATAAGNTAAGQYKKFQARMADLKEEVGAKLLPIMNKLVGFLIAKVVPQLQRLVTWMGQNQGTVKAFAIAIGAVGTAIFLATNPVVLIGIAIAALVAGVIYAYKHFEGFRKVVDAVGRWFRDKLWPAMKAVGAWIIRNFPTWRDAAVGAFHAIWDRIKPIWDGIYQTVKGAIEFVRGIIKATLALVQGDWSGVWNGIKNAFGGIWDAIVGTISSGIAQIRALWDGLSAIGSGAWSWLSDGLVSVMNFILRTIGSGVNYAIDILNGLIDAANHIPGVNIDKLNHVTWGQVGGSQPTAASASRGNGVRAMATGGIVTRATFALIGERGPEAVIPLNRMPKAGNNYTINVQALDAKSAATAVVDALKAYERTRGPVPVRTRAA